MPYLCGSYRLDLVAIAWYLWQSWKQYSRYDLHHFIWSVYSKSRTKYGLLIVLSSRIGTLIC